MAPPESNDLEVVYDSTTHATGLQLRTEDDLYSRGGSAPVELGDSSDTDDEEQAHGKEEVEVIVATSSEPTVTEVADADTAATSSWPPGQPRPNDMFDQIKFDAVFDAVSTDVRMRAKRPQVERLPKDWDIRRKEKLKKEKMKKGQGYVIPRKSTSSRPKVGSTPTPVLLPTPAPEPPAEGTNTASGSSNLPPSSGTIAPPSKPLGSTPIGSAAAKTASTAAVGSTPTTRARKEETGARQKVMQTVKLPRKAPVRNQLVPDHPPPVILPDMSQPPPVMRNMLPVVHVPNFAPPPIASPHHSLTLRAVTTATGTLGHTTPVTTTTSATPSSLTGETATTPVVPQPGVPPPVTSTISATGRKILLATPSQEEIAASRGFGGGSYGRPQANQQNFPRSWENLWWCHNVGCGKSNWVPRTACELCGAPRFNPLYHVVRGLKRKLVDAQTRIAELESESKQRKT